MTNSSIKNVQKINNYYQVRLTPIDKVPAFYDEADYWYFLDMFERFLTNNDSVNLLAYCLNRSEVNLLLHQREIHGVESLVHQLVLQYNMYLSAKYKKEDVLREGTCEISLVLPEDLLQISREIHTSPENYLDFPFSSLRAYFYNDVPQWLDKFHIATKYKSAVEYAKFLESL